MIEKPHEFLKYLQAKNTSQNKGRYK